jgi:hypothetical protein
MDNLSADLAAEESPITFQVVQQVQDIIDLNESRESTKNLIREIAISKIEIVIFFVEYHFITRALVCRSATANHLCEELNGLQCIQTLLQD